MGNTALILLVSSNALSIRLAAAANCMAHSEAACHSKAGCRWYEYKPVTECKLCDKVHANKLHVTGCRDWTPFTFCKGIYHDFAKEMLPTNLAFQNAVKYYHISQGTGEPGNPWAKRWSCSVWCDTLPPFTCEGQPSALEEFRGVNYGGRFVPERYLGLKGTEELFYHVKFPPIIEGHPVQSASLCDVAQFTDAKERFSRFLDANIEEKHFRRMAELGFNVVRLPLGYWNMLDLPGGLTPNGASVERWRWLQTIMPSKAYRKWIDLVFVYARRAGLRVLLDLHGAPGAQTGNAFTGCDQGKGHYNFNTAWNKKLAVDSIEQMAKICKEHGPACYGIELLNEPELDYNNEDFRVFLRGYYEEAIKAARRHIDHDTPVLVMDWTHWLPWWQQQNTFGYHDYGRVVLSTHLYDGMATPIQHEAREQFRVDFTQIEAAFFGSKYEVIVSEYGLSGHLDDRFDLHSFASWLVHELRQRSLGSAVWNYDAAARDWGPVAQASRCGVDWAQIFDVQSGANLRWSWGRTALLMLCLAVTAGMTLGARQLVNRLRGTNKDEEKGEDKAADQELLNLGEIAHALI